MLEQPDGHDLQAVDVLEVSGIAGIDRKEACGPGQSPRSAPRRRARRSFPPRCPQRGSCLAESARRRRSTGNTEGSVMLRRAKTVEVYKIPRAGRSLESVTGRGPLPRQVRLAWRDDPLVAADA